MKACFILHFRRSSLTAHSGSGFDSFPLYPLYITRCD